MTIFLERCHYEYILYQTDVFFLLKIKKQHKYSPSMILAQISAPTPNWGQPPSTVTRWFVFITLASMVSMSRGLMVRRFMTWAHDSWRVKNTENKVIWNQSLNLSVRQKYLPVILARFTIFLQKLLCLKRFALGSRMWSTEWTGQTWSRWSKASVSYEIKS